MDCSTIIVSYNTFELTAEAIRSALASGRPIDHEVIVVDNASPDSSYDRLLKEFPAEEFPNVHILGGSDNVGFSAANNIGAARAKGSVLFFLNPDTVVHDDAIPKLTAFLNNHPDVGIVGPLVLNSDGSEQHSVMPFPSVREFIRHRIPLTALFRPEARRLDENPPESGPVDIVKGCGLALRRDVFNRVDGWDESYFMYSEETELCWRMREEGLNTIYYCDAVITHHGGVSTRERYVDHQLVVAKSQHHFLRRHGKPTVRLANRITGVVGFGCRAVLLRLLGRLRGPQADEYNLRADAASALWRWYFSDYSVS